MSRWDSGGMNMVPKILVVDDEPYILRSLTFLMEKQGYKTITATNGEEALSKIQEEQPDLLLLDVMMPKKDGFQVCREVRDNPEMGNPYIIMLTARGQAADRQKGLRAGADEFLTKPFSPSKLVKKVKAALEAGAGKS